MPQRPLPANKIRKLLHFSVDDYFNKTETAKGLRIARTSATKYINAFKNSTLTLTDVETVGSAKLAKLLFPNNSRPAQSNRKVSFLDRIETVHSRIEHDRLSIRDVWREEVATQQPGYKYTQFSSLYAHWRIEQGLRRPSSAKRKAVTIKPIDIPILKRWSLSRDRRKWEVAIALLNSSAGVSTFKTAEKIGRARRIVEKWYLIYERDGIESLPLKRSRKSSEDVLAKLEAKKNNLIKIIHESPKAYDINRASWSLKTLAGAYQKTHGERISVSSISEYFTSAGYELSPIFGDGRAGQAAAVRTNADLLHFQSAPSEPESSIGGVDLIGAAAQASIRNAIMSKGRFIAVLLFI
jgi:transposase